MIDILERFRQFITVMLGAGLMLFGPCPATGCSSGSGKAQVRNGRMQTQFEVSWGTTVKIGFPGTLDFEGDVSGEKADVPPATDVPPTTPQPDATP